MEIPGQLAVLGHSHSICLMDAIGDWRKSYKNGEFHWKKADLTGVDFNLPLQLDGLEMFKSVNYFPISRGTDGDWLVAYNRHLDTPMKYDVSEAYEKCLERLQGTTHLISCLWGNNFATEMYVQNMPRYDFLELGLEGNHQVSVSGDVTPIDRRDIRFQIIPIVGRMRAALQLVKDRYPDVQIYHLLPPPPAEKPEAQENQEVFSNLFEKHGVVDKKLRMKWYNSFCFMMREFLEKIGVQVLAAPIETKTKEGFIKPEFQKDITHGNQLYGAACWKNIAKLIGS